MNYYQAFQNVWGILEELQILLAPDKEHKKGFPEAPIVGWQNAKSLNDHLVREVLPKMDNAGGSEPCGKSTFQKCDHIITTNFFTTNACGEAFKIQSGPFKGSLSSEIQNLENFMLEKLKQSFVFVLIIIKVNTNLFEKENRMYDRSVFIHSIFKIATEVLMIGK